MVIVHLVSSTNVATTNKLVATIKKTWLNSQKKTHLQERIATNFYVRLTVKIDENAENINICKNDNVSIKTKRRLGWTLQMFG